MSVKVDSARVHAALGSAAKAEILRTLRSAARPLSARELSAKANVPLSTLRFHLDGLADSGLIEARAELPSGRGRPRLLYTAVVANVVGDGYRWLSGLLAGSFSDASAAPPAERAERAGTRWAEANSRMAGADASFEDAVNTVTGVFTEFGFEPEAVTASSSAASSVELRLHACPFIDVARDNPEVICSVHAGLMKSLLSRSGAPDAEASLHPFMEPGLCVAVIEPGSAGLEASR